MQGFKDYFIACNGFWPAQANEPIEISFVRLADVFANFADSSAGRGDFSEITHAGITLPAKQKHPQILDGLYRVFWKTGGASLCAIGFNSDGSNWIAPTNWTAPANISDLELSGSWGEFDRLEKVVDFDVYKLGEPAKVSYRNYRGEVSIRTITPLKPWYGSTEWHPEPQWFLNAFDHEKDAERDFALADFGGQSKKVTVELVRSVDKEVPRDDRGHLRAAIVWELRVNGAVLDSVRVIVYFSVSENSLKAPPPDLRKRYDDLNIALGRCSYNADDDKVTPALSEFCDIVDLIESRALASDGPVTPFLDELNASTVEERNRFINSLMALYRAGRPEAGNV